MALMLSRKLGESIVVTALDGSKIVIEVGAIRGTSVRLGVTASLDYTIRRSPSLRVMEENDVGGISVDHAGVLDPLPRADFCGGAVGEAACGIDEDGEIVVCNSD